MHFLYIDPGSGSLLFQALLSGFLTVVVFSKRIISYIKYSLFKKKRDEDDEAETPE